MRERKVSDESRITSKEDSQFKILSSPVITLGDGRHKGLG